MSENAASALEEIEPIKPLEAIQSGQPESLSLEQLSGLAVQESIASGNLSFAIEGAMSTMTQSPGSPGETTSLKDEFTVGFGGEVGQQKVDIMGDTAAASGTSETTENTEHDKMMDRFTDLYSDMTVYQVAWSIARRVQQDTSQLLRGQ